MRKNLAVMSAAMVGCGLLLSACGGSGGSSTPSTPNPPATAIDEGSSGSVQVQASPTPTRLPVMTIPPLSDVSDAALAALGMNRSNKRNDGSCYKAGDESVYLAQWSAHGFIFGGFDDLGKGGGNGVTHSISGTDPTTGALTGVATGNEGCFTRFVFQLTTPPVARYEDIASVSSSSRVGHKDYSSRDNHYDVSLRVAATSVAPELEQDIPIAGSPYVTGMSYYYQQTPGSATFIIHTTAHDSRNIRIREDNLVANGKSLLVLDVTTLNREYLTP